MNIFQYFMYDINHVFLAKFFFKLKTNLKIQI
jgi:hypothetical protein